MRSIKTMRSIDWMSPILALACSATLMSGCDDDDPANTADHASNDGGEDETGELDFGPFDELLEGFVEEQGLVGMSAAVVDREQGVVHVAGYGDFSADRVYAIASSTKMLTAGVIARLSDQGVVDLDAPIGNYVDDVWGDGGEKASLTLAQLLSMSGGLVGLENPDYEPYTCLYQLEGTIEDCARAIYEANDAADRLPPDTEFRYGGPTYQLAGGVAIVASGKGWDELVRETYSEPCGTESLGYTNFWHGVISYPPGFDGDPDNAPETDNHYLGAGAYVTAEDYAEVLRMHLRGGMCGDNRVLSEQAVARMQVDRIGEVYGGKTGSDAFPGYGLGWWVSRELDVVVDSGAHGSDVWLDNTLGYATIIVIEADTTAGGALLAEAFPLLTEIFGGERPEPEPDDTTEVPELTNAQCLEGPQSSPAACQACACEHCLTEVATCTLFDEGRLCDEITACQWAHYDECGPDANGETSCYYDSDGTLAQGPCAAEINNAAAGERGAGTSAVFAGACNRAPTANACAAIIALGTCVDTHCQEVCDPAGDAMEDADAGSP